MDNQSKKPRLIFFQGKYQHLPNFVLKHKSEHVKCLSEFFEVVVIHEDCNYQQICDKYEPDMALFEGGVSFPSRRRQQITNIESCPQVAKVGLLHTDGFGEGRSGFLSDMDHWGVSTFFAIAVTAPEYTPGIAANLFVWPNSIDSDTFHDYGQSKSIPVLFTGNTNELYPWRQKIIKLVSKHYPSLICPHPGYGAKSAAKQVLIGEPYARMLNASSFAPACGTVAKEIIRKHFEAPGCRACLVTEESPGLKAAGFVDMKNCVFADEHDVLDKLTYLFEHPEEAQAITDAGYELVHARHTLKHRDQLLQWYTLNKGKKPGQRITQSGPFARLDVVDESSAAGYCLVSNSLHLSLMRQGDSKLLAGQYEEAERLYAKCLSYYPLMPEPIMKIAICSLHKGNAKNALSLILKPIEFTLAVYKATDPDPVEWTYYIVSLLCLGRLTEAGNRAMEFPRLHHPELDSIRWVIDALDGNPTTIVDGPRDPRISVHQLPRLSVNEWINQLCIMLKACGQHALAKRVTASVVRDRSSLEKMSACETTAVRRPVPLLGAGMGDARNYFKRRLFYGGLKARAKRHIRRLLQHFEAKYGLSLPYHLSQDKNDEFFHAVQVRMQEDEIRTVLVLGAAPAERCTQAVLAGIAQNNCNPRVFCIGVPSTTTAKAERESRHASAVTWFRMTCSPATEFREELQTLVENIKAEHQIASFDAIVIDSSELERRGDSADIVEREMYKAKFVFLEDINGVFAHGNYDRLLMHPSYSLLDRNSELRNGYAIFEKSGPDLMRVCDSIPSSSTQMDW